MRIHLEATIFIYSRWNFLGMRERVDERQTKHIFKWLKIRVSFEIKFENFTNRNHNTTFGVNLWLISETKLNLISRNPNGDYWLVILIPKLETMIQLNKGPYIETKLKLLVFPISSQLSPDFIYLVVELQITRVFFSWEPERWDKKKNTTC